MVEHYTRLNRRPIAAVLPDSPEEDLFRSHGWVPESADANTVFMLAGVAAARRSMVERAPVPRASVVDRPPVVEPTLLVEPTPVVELVETPHAHQATVTLGDHASGLAAYAEDWVGFRSIEVDPAHRRQGLGLAVMAELLEWGAEQGATTAYLQVLGDNAPALALYERLGFTEHHAYRYVATPGGAR